jgi:hypothetical protein
MELPPTNSVLVWCALQEQQGKKSLETKDSWFDLN